MGDYAVMPVHVINSAGVNAATPAVENNISAAMVRQGIVKQFRKAEGKSSNS